MATTTRARQRARAGGVLWLVATALAITAFVAEYRRDGRLSWARLGVIGVCATAAVVAFARQPTARDDAHGDGRGGTR
jgi:hypothetical protein